MIFDCSVLFHLARWVSTIDFSSLFVIKLKSANVRVNSARVSDKSLTAEPESICGFCAIPSNFLSVTVHVLFSLALVMLCRPIRFSKTRGLLSGCLAGGFRQHSFVRKRV